MLEVSNSELGLPFPDEQRSPSERATSALRHSMIGFKQSEPFDEYITIDSVCQPCSVGRFEFIADTLFRLERLYFDEPIRGVTVKMKVSRSKQWTRYIPMSWFCGVGKDGKLGQSLNQFRALDIGGSFTIEFDNQTHMSIRILGVLAGTMIGHKK